MLKLKYILFIFLIFFIGNACIKEKTTEFPPELSEKKEEANVFPFALPTKDERPNEIELLDKCDEYFEFIRNENGDEAGFIQFEEGRESFYSFHRYSGENKYNIPIFVLLNGGPGYASDILHAMGTGPQRFFLNEKVLGFFEENPSAWTDMGDLLYLNPVGASFSGDEQSLTLMEHTIFSLQTVIRFIQCQLGRLDAPIVFVGESAAGEQLLITSRMVRISLRQLYEKECDSRYCPELNNKLFDGLVRELREFADKVDPVASNRFGYERAFRLFPGNIYIQSVFPIPSIKDSVKNEKGNLFEGIEQDYLDYIFETLDLIPSQEAQTLYGVSISSLRSISERLRKGMTLQKIYRPFRRIDNDSQKGNLNPEDWINALKYQGNFITNALRDEHLLSAESLLFFNKKEYGLNVDFSEVSKLNFSSGKKRLVYTPTFDAVHIVSLSQAQELHDAIYEWISHLK